MHLYWTSAKSQSPRGEKGLDVFSLSGDALLGNLARNCTIIYSALLLNPLARLPISAPIIVRYRKEKRKSAKGNAARGGCGGAEFIVVIYRPRDPAKVVASVLAALVVVLVMVSAAIANEESAERERVHAR